MSPTRALGLAAAVLVLSPLSSAQTAPYLELDRIEGPFVDLPSFPVRPMVQPGTNELWVVNQPAGTVEKLDLMTGTSQGVFGVARDPVAIAWWHGPDGASGNGDDEILVACRSTWALVRLARMDGRIVGVVQPSPDLGRMAEPGDVLVDQSTNMAFVSCTGSDSVVQIDLRAVSDPIVRIFDEENDAAFVSRMPLFLSFDAGGDVLVAPLVSGNNTTWRGFQGQSDLVSGAQVLDLTQVSAEGLDDEDLFRIEPWVSPAQPGSVSVAANSTGTLLFAHGRQSPTTLWQLNTEARNQGPQGEPAITGEFVSSRLSIVDLTTGAITVKDLDPSGMGGSLPISQAVGQPFALDFDASGQGFVTGLLTDNVAILSSSGDVIFEWDVTTGSPFRAIPRGVLVTSSSSADLGEVAVYCWGDGTVRTYRYDVAAQTAVTLNVFPLSHDPTPGFVREGRSLFFDGSNSKHENMSCASCHVEGGTDSLVWNLSGIHDIGNMLPIDDKGGMLTQSMVGLERLAPFHWRGERRLVDFNTRAFPGLLGGSSLSPGDLVRFEAFVFSLHDPPNPDQNRRRVLDDSITFLGPSVPQSAVNGQSSFVNELTFQAETFACADCHTLPTGTNNDVHEEQQGASRPRRAHMKVAPLRSLGPRDGPKKTFGLIDPPFGEVALTRGYLGTGFAHTGTFADLFDFVATVVAIDPANELQVERNIHAFLRQLDSGLAPATAYAFHLRPATKGQATAEVRNYLLVQAAGPDRSTDIVVISSMPGITGERRWFYDRTGAYSSPPSSFVCEDPALTNRSFDQFLASVDPPFLETHLFLGLPTGMGERFGVDFDGDGLLNLSDPDEHTFNAPTVELPPPSFRSMPEVVWETARVARVWFETHGLVRAEVRYKGQGEVGCPQTIRLEQPGRSFSVVLKELEASTGVGNWSGPQPQAQSVDYDVEVEIENLESTPQTYSESIVLRTDEYIAQPTFVPDDELLQRQLLTKTVATVVDLQLSPPSSGVVAGTVSIVTSFQRGGSFASGTFRRPRAPGRVVVGRLIGLPVGADPVTIDPVPGANALEANEVLVVEEMGPLFTKLEVAGDDGGGLSPFLVTAFETDASGATQMDFSFSLTSTGLVPGDEVLFVIDTIVEIPDPSQWPPANPTSTLSLPTWHPGYSSQPPAPANGPRALTQWSFPDTTEERDRAKETIPSVP